VPMMVQKTWGQYPEYGEDEDQTLMKKLGVDEIEGRVIAIPRVESKLDDDEIKIDGEDGGIFEVVGAVDFELAFGNEVTAYVKKDKVIGLTIESDFFLDAIKWDGDELTLVQEDEDYDLAVDEDDDIDVIVWINGVKGDADDDADDDGDYDYAKVVLNDDGDVAFIEAYIWEGVLVVEEVDGDEVFGYGDELDLEDYVVVKNGRTIAVEDIEEGDILFFNEDAEFAEVYNVSYEGKITRVYDDSFRVDKEEFDFGFVQGATFYIDGSKLKDFTPEVAEDMEDEGGEVTVFVDRYGDAVLVVGDLGEAETSTFYAMVIEDMVDDAYWIRNKEYYNLDVINEEGKELNYDVLVSDASEWGIIETSEGDIIKKLVVGDIVKIEVDEDGDIEEVVLLPDDDGDGADIANLETDKSYAAGFKLQSSAVVFNVEDVWDGADFEDDFDVDDIVVTTFGELDFDEIEDGLVIANKDGKVIVVVVYKSSREEEKEIYTAVAIADPKKVSGKKIWKLEVNVEGEERTYETKEDKFANVNDILEGVFLEITVDENTGLVIDYDVLNTEADGFVENLVVVERSTRDMTVTVDPGDEDDYIIRLSDATILDATDDYEVIGIRDLEAGDNLVVLLVEADSSYAKYVVVVPTPEP